MKIIKKYTFFLKLNYITIYGVRMFYGVQNMPTVTITNQFLNLKDILGVGIYEKCNVDKVISIKKLINRIYIKDISKVTRTVNEVAKIYNSSKVKILNKAILNRRRFKKKLNKTILKPIELKPENISMRNFWIRKNYAYESDYLNKY